MSTFTTISPSAIQQVTGPYEQPQEPFLLIQAQQTDQLLLKNCETQIGLETSTAQNQSEFQILSTTRDNISGKQTLPAVVRPKTKIHESRLDSGELDINVQSQRASVSYSNSECTVNRHEYRKDSQLSVSSWYYCRNYDSFKSKEQLSHSTGVQFSNEYSNKFWYFANHNDVKRKGE